MEAEIRTRASAPPHLEVLQALEAAADALRAATEARLPWGLSQTQFAVLRDFLRFGDGASPAEIAARLRMSRGAVTHLLQKMETRGWIRLAGDDRDGRRKQVFLTPDGARTAREAVAALRPGTDRLKNDLNDNYLREGLAFLQELGRRLDALSAGDGPSGSPRERR
jgi:DNA-binding MarR family transcriptional regulator